MLLVECLWGWALWWLWAACAGVHGQWGRLPRLCHPLGGGCTPSRWLGAPCVGKRAHWIACGALVFLGLACTHSPHMWAPCTALGSLEVLGWVLVLVGLVLGVERWCWCALCWSGGACVGVHACGGLLAYASCGGVHSLPLADRSLCLHVGWRCLGAHGGALECLVMPWWWPLRWLDWPAHTWQPAQDGVPRDAGRGLCAGKGFAMAMDCLRWRALCWLGDAQCMCACTHGVVGITNVESEKNRPEKKRQVRESNPCPFA